MDLVLVSTTVASMDAGVERTRMYSKRVVETNTVFMSRQHHFLQATEIYALQTISILNYGTVVIWGNSFF